MFVFNKDDFTAYLKRHLAMDLFRPADHPRAPNGRFTSSGGSGGGGSNSGNGSIEEYRKQPIEKRCGEVYDRHKANIDKAQTPDEIADAIRRATQDVYGSVGRDFSGKEELIRVGNVLAGHLRTYFKGSNGLQGDEAKQTAERILFGLSKLPDILKNGKIVSVDGAGEKGWNHNPNHNPDNEFLSLMCEYEFQGQKRKFVVDVRRKHNGNGVMNAYHINAEGNSSFTQKQGSLSFDAKPTLEVCDIRIE